jgi:Nucleotidyl transferase AbiEii toxin, Type IV TA system
MAMRAVHGSVRYTKDIDLDADKRASKERIQGVVRRSIERAVSSGLIANAVVTAPKQTDTSLRSKITGIQPNSKALMHLRVEVSRRPKLLEGHVVEAPLHKSFNQTGRDVGVQVLDAQHIAVTKTVSHRGHALPASLLPC